jgi:hypothetical protein
MLDINYRAMKNQMTLDKTVVFVMHDTFEPVMATLYRLAEAFEVILDCPEAFIVVTDRLQLQQVAYNLSRNSAYFSLRDTFASLDVLNQRTGLDLNLCKNVIDRAQIEPDSHPRYHHLRKVCRLVRFRYHSTFRPTTVPPVSMCTSYGFARALFRYIKKK